LGLCFLPPYELEKSFFAPPLSTSAWSESVVVCVLLERVGIFWDW
jgi:hypothetical protein